MAEQFIKESEPLKQLDLIYLRLELFVTNCIHEMKFPSIRQRCLYGKFHKGFSLITMLTWGGCKFLSVRTPPYNVCFITKKY